MQVDFNVVGLESMLNNELQQFNNKSVTVGYLDNPGLDFIAKIQEHGAVIPVTKKMRFYLGMKFGIWLSKKKTHIVIPPRPFMLAAFMEHQSEYAERLMKFYAVSGNIDDALDKLGQVIQKQDIPNSINEHFIRWTPNSPMTVLLKGYNRPLVSKGSLITDIDRKVE